MHERMSEEWFSENWVRTAVEDDRLEDEAVTAVKNNRYGRNAVVWNSDTDANMRAAIGRPIAAGSTATWDDFDDDGDAEPEIYHVDRDGCADPAMSRSQGEVGTDAGQVNRNDSGGQFKAMPSDRIARSDRYFRLCRIRGRQRRRGDRLRRATASRRASRSAPHG